MPDITMCKNEGCIKRADCYRYMAKPNPYWQAYCVFDPEDTGNCDHYWPVIVLEVEEEF